ncbi:acyltransferase domain-containing protein [Paenibacillus glycanilyticus]|uniref:acyltransferase domain-containing protein n=1 Tax=Paenibacillus glycanilyticus TaxID=126569 RepID=UPI00203A926D|nr:acyltransferase domain-containing protein [Paenibacillus glycanilyticus]MCM3630434.1 acyltransferase domain-containing protein [Paenibacillus glycanilyticus]
MQLRELCEGIRLGEEASRILFDFRMEEGEYERLKQHFQTDRHSFFRQVTGEAGYRQKLLYLFARFAVDAYEEYRMRGIEDRIYFDTFTDIRIWSEACHRDFGEHGIEEYNWLQEHVRLRLFRLGRLQFQPMAFEGESLRAGNRSVEKHQLVLNIHIPEGESLTPHEVSHSLQLARTFFRGIPPVYICSSWLLYPGLDKVLKAESNILRFQRLFHTYEVDEESRQAEQRIFYRLMAKPEDYKEETSLQRAAKALLLSGGRLGSGSGVHIPEEAN